MSEQVKLGKVAMTLGGDYSSSQSYDKLTCVQYDGCSWVSKKQVPEGVAPTPANSAYWQKISDRGIQGPQGQSYVDKELVPIVNDLTTGGSANVLSAEQGKVLDGKLTELSVKISGGESSTTIGEFADKGKFLYENITLDSTQYDITDYILLTGVTKVVLSNLWGSPTGVLPYVIYNENKSVIVKAELPTEPSLVNVVLTSLPSDAKYIRCTRDNLTLEPSSITLYKNEGTGLEQKVEHLENNVGGLQDEDKKIKQSVQIVQNDIDTLFEKINGGEQEEVITEFIDKGKFLYGNSTLDSSSYNISDYVKIDGAKKVVLTNVYGATSGVLPYVIYDSQKRIIKQADIPSSDGSFNYELIDLPSGSFYIRCTQDIISNPSIVVYYAGEGLDYKIGELEDKDAEIINRLNEIEHDIPNEIKVLNGLKKNQITDFTTYSAQHLNASNGQLSSSESFTASEYIEVEEGKEYSLGIVDEEFGGYKSETMQEICYYNNNKSFVSAETSMHTIVVPQGVKYLRFSVLSKAYWNKGVDDMHMCEIVEGDKPISVFSQDLFSEVMPKNGLMGKKWLLIGDSNTEHNFRANAKYDEFIASYTGVMPMNIAKSGAGYRVYQNADYVFLNILNKFYNENPNYMPDFITIMGGSNDVEFDTENIGTYTDTTNASVFGMAKILIDRLAEIYPNVPVAIITPFPHAYNNTSALAPFVNEMHKFCDLYNLPLLDLYHRSGIHPENASYNKKYFSCESEPNGDGLHLNYYGQRLISSRIREFLMQYFGEL